MTVHELRELFMEEHKRDKKFTIINFILIAIFISIVVGGLFYIGANFKDVFGDLYSSDPANENPYSWWPKIALPVAGLCLLGYPFFKLWKLSKRPSEIEDLLKRIEQGAKASNVSDYVDHKITIPLLKINLKLVPVNIAMIYLDVDSKAYQLPIRRIYMADLKLFLSGANMAKLNEIREALYGDDDNVDENYITSKVIGQSGEAEVNPREIVMTPIKPVDEFKIFLNEELKGTLDGMEKSRKSVKSQFIIWTAVILVLMGGIVYYLFSSTISAQAVGDYSGGNQTIFIIGFFAVALIGSFLYSRHVRSKHQFTSKGGVVGMESTTDGAAGGGEFKQKVFKRMINFVNPTVEYAPIGHIGLPEVLESGLFERKGYDIDGSDQIMGCHNGVPFIMCDLQMHFKRNFTDEKEGPDEVFCGQYFVARFNKKFSTPVFIKARTGFKGNFTDNSIGAYLANGGSKVVLEDPEFMKMFDVYSDDQIEARYILTPSLMERIKELAKRTKGKYYIAFTNNKISVANNSRTDNFEMGWGFNKSYTKNDNEVIVNFYSDLVDQFSLIDELRLNVKIWG